MKKLLCLTLCLALIMGVMTGCAVKPSGGPGATGESSPEVSNEVTKEPTEEKSTANNEDKKEKKEPTTEFYDFMALDPEPELTGKELYLSMQSEPLYSDARTKKEDYYFHMFKINEWTKNVGMSVIFVSGEEDFYSPKTKEKLENLGFVEYDYGEVLRNPRALDFYCKNAKEKTTEKDIENFRNAIIAALQDHNVLKVYYSKDIVVPC